MKAFKKIFSLVLAIALVISSITVSNVGMVKAATAIETWKTSGITAPAAGKLTGAGYIDIKWDNESIDATKYDVYIDGEKAATVAATEEATMKHEMYTVKVSAHTAKVVAYLADGTQAETSCTFYVTKKGICVNTKDMGTVVDPAALNIGWYYSWGNKSFEETKFKNTKFYGLDYVPMIYGNGSETIQTIMNRVNEQGYKYLLGYNEPDLSVEANISPSTAILRWNEFIKYKGNLRLGSPAISTASAPCESTNWWDPYWNGLTQQGKDETTFIAFHRYYNYYSGAETAYDFLRLIDETYYKFKKPIWVTEFAVWRFTADDASGCAKTQEFMKIVLKGLEERDYVERYSWFSPGVDGEASSSSLFDYATGEITDIGKIYASIGNPAGYNATNYGVDGSTSYDTSTKSVIEHMDQTDALIIAKKKAFKYDVEVKDSWGIAGYEIQYSTKKKFKGNTTNTVGKKKAIGKIKIKFTKKQKKKIKKNKKLKKMTYYVRVRSYKIVGGIKYYLRWCDTKQIKVKVR